MLLYKEESGVEANEILIEALRAAGITDVLLLGGEKAISAEFEQALKPHGIEALRIGGETRYETSVDFAKLALGLHPARRGEKLSCLYSETIAFVSSESLPMGGRESADGVLITPLLAREQGLMFLTAPNEIPSAICQFFRDHSAEMDVRNIWIVGGTARIEQDVGEGIVDMVANGRCNR